LIRKHKEELETLEKKCESKRHALKNLELVSNTKTFELNKAKDSLIEKLQKKEADYQILEKQKEKEVTELSKDVQQLKSTLETKTQTSIKEIERLKKNTYD